MFGIPKRLLYVLIFVVNIFLGVLIATIFFYRDRGLSINYHVAAREEGEDSSGSGMSGLTLQETFNKIAEKNLPAVVSIQVLTVSTAENPLGEFFGDDDFLRRFFGMPPDRLQKRRGQSFGSGFIITKDGYLISNFHVVKNAEKITVLLKDSDKEYEATVVGSDPDTDVALLKIKSGNNFPFVLLGDSDAVRIGDIAIAIGNPFGLSSTFTTGVVSAMGRTGMGNKYENFIQTDVAINPGNSGGPLLSIRGEVVGINSMIFSQSGGSIGISFSIPINMAKRIVDQIRSKGKVTRSWLGIGLSDVTPELARDLEIPQGGVYVPEVSKGSPAEKGGIKAGDILVTLDGNKIRDAADFRNRVNDINPGKTVSIELVRKKKKMEVQVTVEALAENQSPDGEGSGSFLGLKVAAMPDEIKKQYKAGEAFGVVVESIEESSPLAERGVRAGDIVVMVNYEETKTPADYNRVMRNAVKNKKVIFHVQRGSYLRVLAVYIK